LQALEEAYGGPEGKLFIMAMPCNNFGRQESGTNAEIAEFAKKKKATFSVFEKMECDDGKRTAPIYQDLISSPVNGGEGLGWNFAKFLCDKDGLVVKRYSSSSNPSDCEPDIKALIERG
jgi:glutathione peroxidase